MTVERSPRGSTTGKSTDSKTKAMKMYHPRKDTARRRPAPACCKVMAADEWPDATAKKDAERHPTSDLSSVTKLFKSYEIVGLLTARDEE
jgi:hypothetical protein